MLARGVRSWAQEHTGRVPRWVRAWDERHPPLPGFETDDLYVLGLTLALAGGLIGFSIAQDETGAALYAYVAKGFWVAGFLAGALLMTVGIVARWHRAMWLGNGMLATAYSSIAVGLVFVTPHRWAVYAALFLPFAVLHWVIWARVGFRVPPMQEGPTLTVEEGHGG